ncbi:alpha/beta fold hydrolase [Nocardiopsis aegyptia]|uniref:3-oxoadipate enol-lactonase n=1 Tax=Nocardiopsis aegyptia TaxID=220378 RepID=A0A7Z0JCX6_9ACTN|nr:alpha/beta hydrolase [Nocardiopsis aegyptia]NYJ37442.1 3-oxoadipate enol-lactonase [Nocardiopsis aegyptia]
MARPQRVAVGDTELDVLDQGSGEPVVFVQTALTADEFRPLAEHPAVADGHRTVLYHRRGYGDSAPAAGPGSIPDEAAECAELMAALGIARAHVLGGSYGAAIALRLAADAPERVHTLTLLEPPPSGTPGAAGFRDTVRRLIRYRREHGVGAALDEFLSALRWERATFDRVLPGASAGMERDAAAFFDHDLPALLDWEFDAADARRIGCPVLHVGGASSGPLFAEVRVRVLDLLPHADDVVIPGADHAMALTATDRVAAAVAAFLRRHPLPAGPFAAPPG